MTLQLRSGGTLVAPDTATARAEMRLAPDEATATGTWEPMTPIPAPRAMPAIAARPPQAGSNDRLVLTPEARDRAFTRLTRDYTELTAPAGLRRFEKVAGSERLIVDVNAESGAVVRERLWRGASPWVETTRQYRLVGGVQVLSLQTTIMYDDQGRPAQRFEERHTDVRVGGIERGRTRP